MAYLDNLKTGALRVLTGGLALRGSVGTGTLTGNVTLTDSDSYVLLLNPGGTSRNVTLPTAENGRLCMVRNTGTAAANLAVKNPAGTTLATVPAGAWALFSGEDNAWTVVVAPALQTLTDPGNAGAIPVTQSGYLPIVTAGAETRTLAAPVAAGQKLMIYVDTYVGACVITASIAINQTGNNTITLGAVGDMIELTAVSRAGALRWVATANDGAALSTV